MRFMGDTRQRTHAVRRAEAAGAAALTRLRALMLSAMGMLTQDSDPLWRDKAEEWGCDYHAPGPANPSGVQGHVFNMSTDPRFRRFGYARACLEALFAWFRDETEARVISLNATEDGIALYRSLAFTEPGNTVLQLRLDKSR
jgi:GNAT superfamily N-acetyltransferase